MDLSRRSSSRLGNDSSVFRGSAEYINLESKDIICRVKTELDLPIDEKPELLKSFMHKRMVKQAVHSLNNVKVGEIVMSEVSR
jgi:hypothetical protein